MDTEGNTNSPLQIVHYPHPALRHRSKPLKRVDGELIGWAREMFDLMYAAEGIGLACNQVDLPFRMFVVNLAANPDEGEEMVFINPVITQPKGVAEREEGCLSIPQLYGNVKRPKQIKLSAYNLKGEEFSAVLTGMMARVVQHETDHLDGVLFTDRLSESGQKEVEDGLYEFELAFDNQRKTGGIPDHETIQARLAELEQKYC